MKVYNPWDDAGQRFPDVHIERHSIFPAHAAWVPTERVILVDRSINRVERRCALAHELAHMDIGDRPTSIGFFSRRQERDADRLAARRLIRIADLADASRWCHDPREIAAELSVTLDMLVTRYANLHPSELGLIESVTQRCELAA